MTTTPADQPSGRRPTPPRSSHWRWIPIAGAAGWVLAVTIGTALAPAHYNSVRDTISALAAVDSPYGGVMVAGFVTMAIGLAATAVGLWRRLPVLAGRIAAAEVGIAAAATLVAGTHRLASGGGDAPRRHSRGRTQPHRLQPRTGRLPGGARAFCSDGHDRPRASRPVRVCTAGVGRLQPDPGHLARRRPAASTALPHHDHPERGPGVPHRKRWDAGKRP